MKTYTLKEISKKINVNPGKLKQWEKDLSGILEIPRTKQGARIYTGEVLEQLLEIKTLYDKKYSKEMMRDYFEKIQEPKELELETEKASSEVKEKKKTEDPNIVEVKSTEAITEQQEVSLEVLSKINNPVHIEQEDSSHQFFEAVDQYKNNFLSEVREEIKNVIRKEIVDEVKKEISKGTLLTVKSISDSVYKSSASTQAEIHELSKSLEKSTENTENSLKYLSNNIKNVSIETSEDIYNLSKQLSETTEELSHYVDRTNMEISTLTESITKEHEQLIEERKQYRQDITHREAQFQQMLSSFRDVAAAKEKKWWKFWA